MQSMTVAGSLVLSGISSNNSVQMNYTKVKGQLYLNNVKLELQLSMSEIQVEGSVSLEGPGAKSDNKGEGFNGVNLASARIGGSLSMARSKHFGRLNMSGIYIQGSLFLDEEAEFESDIILNGATVQEKLSMKKSFFKGNVKLNEIAVGRSVDLQGAIFYRRLEMQSSVIDGSLNLSGAKFTSKTAAGSGDEGAAVLDLKNTKVNTVHSGKNQEAFWPLSLELNGFNYAHLGNNMASMSAKWFMAGLERQRCFSPGPYHQLAGVLEGAGHPDKANYIRYASKERERKKKNRFGKSWFALSLLKWMIGYGYGAGYFFSLIWVFSLMMVGAGVYVLADHNGVIPAGITIQPIAFSLDLLLPIIELNKAHYSIQFTGWFEYYFYFHKIMGYVLASFLLAGLSGLSKK